MASNSSFPFQSQKQITFSQIKGKFTKDFDTFGKMDPFVKVSIGKNIAKTQTANGAGKQPIWKQNIQLIYYDQPFFLFQAFDEDSTEDQYIGYGKIQIKNLKNKMGNFDVNIITAEGQQVGIVSGKFEIKDLAESLLFIKNIKLDFISEMSINVGLTVINLHDLTPLLNFKSSSSDVSTQAKQKQKGLILNWNEIIRLRIKQNDNLIINLRSKIDQTIYICVIQCSTKDYKVENGNKKYRLFMQKNMQYIGILSFDFNTLKYVSKQQSMKNNQIIKQNQNILNKIVINSLTFDINQNIKQAKIKILLQNNQLQLPYGKIQKNQKFTINKTFYRESQEQKLIFVIIQKGLLSNSVKYIGKISIQNIFNGNKQIKITNVDTKQSGKISLEINSELSQNNNILKLSNIAVNLNQSADLIGESEPFIVFRTGLNYGRTQTGDKNSVQFKKQIQLRYIDQQVLVIQLWDEDLTQNQLVHTQQIKLNDLVDQKGQHIVIFKKNQKQKEQTKGKIKFNYHIKTNKIIPKNIQQPKSLPKQQPKPIQKQQPKPVPKQQPKPIQKQQPKQIIKQQVKQQPKKQIAKQLPKQIIFIQTKKIQKQQSKQTFKQQFQQQKRFRIKTENNSIVRSNVTKNSVILPQLNNYGDRIYDKQSASTLQRAIIAYSVPKASRFKTEQKQLRQSTYRNDSSFSNSSSKGVGFGFGRKKQFPDWMQKNMKENPAPGTYLQQNDNSRCKGPTFGISRKYYEKVLIPKQIKIAYKIQPRKLSPIAQRLI